MVIISQRRPGRLPLLMGNTSTLFNAFCCSAYHGTTESIYTKGQKQFPEMRWPPTSLNQLKTKKKGLTVEPAVEDHYGSHHQAHHLPLTQAPFSIVDLQDKGTGYLLRLDSPR